MLDIKHRFVIYVWNSYTFIHCPAEKNPVLLAWAGNSQCRNTYKLAQLEPECSTFSRQRHGMFGVPLAGKRCAAAPRFFSQKRRNSKCKTSCQIIRTANPGHSSTRGMILGIWNSVRGARWNQIKTKLPSVRLQARNPRLSMNFDRYKGNKRRENREGVVLYFRWALLLWAARSRMENPLSLRKKKKKQNKTVDFFAFCQLDRALCYRLRLWTPQAN